MTLSASAKQSARRKKQLSELRLIRGTIVEAAVVGGMSQRQIAELLGISHHRGAEDPPGTRVVRRTVDDLRLRGFNAG
jgi:FixJ family two-component response regulator